MHSILNKNPIVVILFAPILFALVISLLFLPAAFAKPKEIPIVLISLDEGAQGPAGRVNMGEMIIQNIVNAPQQQNSGRNIVAWTVLDGRQSVEQGFNEKLYYGALIIPQNFSQAFLSSFSSTPVVPVIEIMINQGLNVQVAEAVSVILHGVAQKSGEGIQANIKEVIISSNMVNQTMLESLINPIKINETHYNAVGEGTANGMGHAFLFLPTWVASVGAAALIFFSLIRKNERNWQSLGKQLALGLLAGLLIGFSVATIGAWMLQISFNFIAVAFFLSLAATVCIWLIIAVVAWLGVAGLGMAALFVVLGFGLIMLPMELVPTIYKDWVYSWLPLRFILDGLREIFYFSSGWWTGASTVLCFIGLGSLVVFLASKFRPASFPVR